MERTPVENLEKGALVQAVKGGPVGTVIETGNYGWISVEYGENTDKAVISYKNGEDKLYVVSPLAPSDEAMNKERVSAYELGVIAGRNEASARIAELEANQKKLVEALDMALYYLSNLERLKNAEVVRDFAESEAGARKAKKILEKYR
jgi:hypothetical protein